MSFAYIQLQKNQFLQKIPGAFTKRLYMKKLLLLFILQATGVTLPAQLSVKSLVCENLSNPIGLDVKQPRFSWQLVSDKRNTLQSAYE